MFEKLLKKFNYLSGMLAFGILMGLIVFLANCEISDFDLWLHLKTGKVIVEQGFIPVKDIFSCTVFGQPWNNHEWLFQSFFYLIFSMFGYDGLFMAQAVIVMLTFMLLFLLSDIRSRHYFTVFLLFLLGLVYQTRFTMRPDLLSLLFFTFYIYILSIHLGRRISVFLLLIVQILWVNVHGFFIFGPLLVFVGIISELIKRRVKLPWEWNNVGRLTKEEFHQLNVILIFSLLACLANPQFIKGALYPIIVLFQMAGESGIFFNYIQELQKPIIFSDIFSSSYPYYKALIFISLYSFYVNRKKIDISALFLWIIFLIFSLKAVRNMTYFGIVSYLVTILNFSEKRLGDILPFKFKKEELKLITIALLNIGMIVLMVRFGYTQSNRVYFDFEKYEMKSSYGGVSLRNFPWAAAEFINKNKVYGNFFNDFNSGAFLVGYCFPGVRVFLDGRTELYGPRFFKEYMKILGDGNKEAFLNAVKKYQLTGAFLNSIYNRVPDKILQLLYNDKEWVLIYLDYDAIIFLKDVPQNKALIEKFRKDKKGFSFSDVDLQQLGPRGVFPYREIKRAYNLEAIGLDQAALEEANLALAISPSAPEPYFIRGKIAEKKKDYIKAFADLRIATMLLPEDAEARYHLALTYAALKDYKNAIKQYRTIARGGFKKSEVFLKLAEAYQEEGQYSEAWDVFQKAVSMAPHNVNDLFDVADIFVAKKEYKEALEAYKLIARMNPRESKAYYKIGLCFEAMGKTKEAREAFLRGLRIDPANMLLKKEVKRIDLQRK